MPPIGCSQCGRPAVAQTGDGLPLCLECFQTLGAVMRQRWEMSATMANQALAEMERVIGMPGLFERIQIPRPAPIIHSAPTTFHNIRIDRSIIGVINHSEVQQIDVNLTSLHNAGNDAAGDALKTLTEAALTEKALNDAQRSELIEQLAFLSSQAVTPPAERKTGIIKAVMGAVGRTTATIAGLLDLWLKAEPILKAIFRS